MAGVSLKLLVLKTRQPDRLRTFYQAFGVELVEERHGSGPHHYAGQVGDTVLEIYPLRDEGCGKGVWCFAWRARVRGRRPPRSAWRRSA